MDAACVRILVHVYMDVDCKFHVFTHIKTRAEA